MADQIQARITEVAEARAKSLGMHVDSIRLVLAVPVEVLELARTPSGAGR